MATLPTTTEFNALQARISKVYGIGEGDYGYGQVALSQPLDPVNPANLLDFQNLRTDILAAKQHQVGVLTTLPITPITNLITSAQWTSFSTVLAQVEANRLVTPPASQASRDLLISDTITSEWNGTTTQLVNVEFIDEDAIRNYFNTGSTIEFSASRFSGAATTKNASWTGLLASIGVVSFKRSATSSTKAVGTSIGYSKLTDSYQTVFQKVSTDTLRPNTYKISARLADTKTIEFAVEFIDSSITSSDPNVSGTLTSNVNAFHASGAFVAVPAPTAYSDGMSPGQANPSFFISRDANSIGEGQTGVTFTVTTSNFDDAPLYWTVKGYGITAADFAENTLTGTVDIVNGVGSFSLTANDDHFTEGTEKFVVEIRIDDLPTSKVVASISSSPEVINDLSVTVPVIVTTPSYNFVSQSVSSTSEGQTVTYTVVTTGVPDGTQLGWSTKGLTAGITPADFEDNTLTGTVTVYNNTCDIVRTLVDDKSVEAVESFQIVLSTISSTGVRRQVQISYLMQIIDTAVVVPDVPYIVTTSLSTVPEGSSLAVNYKITTPKLPLGTRLYWQTFADVGTITGGQNGDFNDGLLSGSVLITNQVGVVPRFLKADGITEGLESFHLTFYSDEAMTNELQQGPTVSITESVSYVMTRDVNTMSEGSLGINFTVNTPALENGTVLYYTIVSESGTVDVNDFVNGLTGTFTINNNVGKFLVRATDDSTVEGIEQFRVEVRATDGVSGPILVSSQSSTITEAVVYDMLLARTAITEGEIGVDITVKTPKLPNGTLLYWSTVTATGTIVASDFTDNTLTGTVSITNNIGTITRTAVVDALTEGDESFRVVLKTGSASGTTVFTSDPITISEYVKYSIAPATQSISESGAGVQFNITTPKVSNGSLVYWTILPGSGNITADDFIVSDAQGGSAQRLSGRVSIQNNRGSFIISARPDSLTEGSETFQVELRLDDIDGPVQQTTRSITISETVSYQVIAGAATVNEGPGSVTFTVRTPKVDDNTELYWTTRAASGTVTESDFKDSTLQGKVTIVGNEGTIIRTVKDDVLTEGVDAFVLELRLTGYGSPVVVSSVPVTIQDTSLTIEVPEPEAPVYSIASSTTSIIKGGSVTFAIHTENVTDTENLYWTLFRSPGLEITDFVTAVSPSAVHVTYDDGSTPANGTKEVTITTQSSSAGSGVRSFIFELRTGSVYGKVVATSTTAVTISDEIKYGIAASTRSISEGAGLVTFTVTTPASAIGNTIGWEVVGTSGTLSADDFSDGQTPIAGPGSLTGNITVTSVGTGASQYGTGTFTLYANADAATEGNETFRVDLYNQSTLIILPTPAPIIAISEVVDYLLTANTASISEGGDGVTFTLTTPKLKADTVFNYTVVGKTGTLAAQDFATTAGGIVPLSSLSGTVTVSSSTNTGTFTLYAIANDSTEGDESFTISLTSATNQSITLGTGSPTVTITESVEYTIVPTISEISSSPVTSFAEGSTAFFKVTTPKMDDGTMFWVIEPDPSTSDINEEDFTDKKMSGTVSIVKNKGTIQIQHALLGGTEGNETYRVALRRDSLEGTTVKTSATVTVTEAVSYTVTSDKQVIAENGSVIFTVNTPYADNGVTLQWTVVQVSGTTVSSDFVAFSGDALVTNSTAIITVTAASDGQIEPNDSFTIAITKNGSAITPLAGVIPTITITDGTDYTLSSDVTTISEDGPEVKFTVRTPGISTETVLYWSVQGVSGAIDATDFVKASGTVTIAGHIGYFSVKAVADKLANEGDSFSIILKSGSQTGTAININNTPIITIVDKEFYTIKADKTSIDEGDTAGVTFTITTPSAINGTKLYYNVIGPKGMTTASKNLTPGDFTIPSLPTGTLNGNPTSVNVANNTVTITLIAADDATTDGDKEFYIQVTNIANGTPINFADPCPKVIMKDTRKKPDIITKTIELTHQNTPVNIVENGSGDITFTITPFNTNVLKPLEVTWALDSSTARGIASAISLTKGGNAVNTGKITTVIDPASPLVSTGTLRLYVNKLPIDVSGTVVVTFTVNDPFTNSPVRIATTPINVIHGDAELIIEYDTSKRQGQWFQKIAGVDIYKIELLAGGGQGGGAGAALGGGDGGNGSAVAGIINLVDLPGLYFDIIPGGESLPTGKNIEDWCGVGGKGGDAIAMYLGGTKSKPKSGNPWVTAGGGGGGGGGRLSGPNDGGTGFSGQVSSSTAKFSSTFTSAGGTCKTGNGAGGGGGGIPDPQTLLAIPNAPSRTGGTGGTSFVPAASCFMHIPSGGGLGGKGVKLQPGTPNEGSYLAVTKTINKQVYGIPKWFIDYSISIPDAAPKDDPLFVVWHNVVSSKSKPAAGGASAIVAGQPIPQGTYILNVWTDTYGSVAFGDNKPIDASKKAEFTVNIPATWDNRITVFYQWYNNSKNVCGTKGISVTLRRQVDSMATDDNYIWTSRSPGAMIRPQFGAGANGTSAKVRISWGPAVPTSKAVKPVKAVYPTTPPVVSVPARPVTVVTYDTLGSKYFSYKYPNWSHTMYWEDLWIPVVPGLVFWNLKCDDTGWAKVYDTFGNTQTILPGTEFVTINQTLSVITKIEVYYQDIHGGVAGASGAIKSSSSASGVILWTTRDQAIHYK